MAAPDNNKSPRQHLTSPASESDVGDRRPKGKRPEEPEALDEKILDQVLRDCPL